MIRRQILKPILGRSTGANIQLALLIGIIFIVPLLTLSIHAIAYKIGFTLLLLASAFSLQTKRRLAIILIVAVLIALEWLAPPLIGSTIDQISQIARALFFVIVVIGLIRQTAAAKRVTEQVIVNAISGYLMLGMVFTIGTLMIANWNEGAYTFIHSGDDVTTYMNKFIYYTFITYTTTGYGDMVPVIPVARSFSIFIAVSGQLYLAIIIALLIGKYASMSKEE